VHNLSSGVIFKDLELSLTHISRAFHYSTLNISETVRDDCINQSINQHFLLTSKSNILKRSYKNTNRLHMSYLIISNDLQWSWVT